MYPDYSGRNEVHGREIRPIAARIARKDRPMHDSGVAIIGDE